MRFALLCEEMTGASVWQRARFLLEGVWVQRLWHATELAHLIDFTDATNDNRATCKPHVHLGEALT